MSNATTEGELRESMREWAETARPGEEPHDFIFEEADRILIWNSDVIEICEREKLWNEEPQIEPRDNTPMAAAQAVAFDWAEGIMWEEWRDIESDRDGGELFWCEEHGKWVPTDETSTCEDCDTQECSAHTTIKDRAKYGAALCDDCYEIREDQEEEVEPDFTGNWMKPILEGDAGGDD